MMRTIRKTMDRRGSALVEFTIILPFLLILLIGLVDICILIDGQLRLIHLGREAASILSRGGDFTQTFSAITTADGLLDLDSDQGLIILTRVALDGTGNPVIVQQQRLGGLGQVSTVGTLPPNAPNAPAVVPNGRTVPPNMTVVIVELFSAQSGFLGSTGYSAGNAAIVLSSRAVF